MLPFGNIFCPVDFSPPSRHALDAAVELAGSFNSELALVHVTPVVPPLAPSVARPRTFDVQQYQQELKNSAAEALQDLIDHRLPPGIRCRHILLQGDAATEIVAAAQDQRADLIVIATHGHTGWRRLVFGSVTEKVVRSAGCPVLTVSPPLSSPSSNSSG
jgi:nucleotide-binding universal stress UspA family protein